MIHTITNISKGIITIYPPQPIDNRDGALKVGLRQLQYTVGWYNIYAGESIIWRRSGNNLLTAGLTPGLWNFHDLQKQIERYDVELSVNQTDGLINLEVPEGLEIRLTNGLIEILGLSDGKDGKWLATGTHRGERAVNFSVMRELKIYLEQLSTSSNYVDGEASTLLDVITIGPHAFGDTATVYRHQPLYKRLATDLICELKIILIDNMGQPLNNHDQPINVVLEIV